MTDQRQPTSRPDKGSDTPSGEPTPRTDAVVDGAYSICEAACTTLSHSDYNALAEHARLLERELDQATDHLCQVEGVATMYEKRLGPCEHSPVKCAQCSVPASETPACTASETRTIPTPTMLEAGELQYLTMMNPGARDFASNPFGRALVEAIYNAMEAARVRT